MSRKIVFINQATGYLTIDIINEFANSGKFDKVALIAGSIRLQDVALSDKVEQCKIALYNRGNPKRKFFSWLKGTLQIFWVLLTKYRSYEVFYITIPPFAYLLSLLLKNRFSVLIFDVYPDVLQIFNISPNHPMYRLWARWNKSLFKRVYRLYTIGDGMANLLERYVPREKIIIIPNWSGLTNVRSIVKTDNIFLKDQGLERKFIVQYSGNIGYTHNIEVLVEVAKLMQDQEDIYFLIIGRGEKFKSVQSIVNQYNLQNCRLLPFQPDNILNYTLSAADLGVVLLDEKTAHVSIPSKIYNLQNVGVPILGIADVKSELANHLAIFKNGACFNQNNFSAIRDYILLMKNDSVLYQEAKENSIIAAKKYTMANAGKYLEEYV